MLFPKWYSLTFTGTVTNVREYLLGHKSEPPASAVFGSTEQQLTASSGFIPLRVNLKKHAKAL